MGVTSRISVTLKPWLCSARSALSRPAPGPFTNTATERIPCSCARRAASSAASCAANGVDLRDPLKPRAPALDQATALPLMSVIVTTVLLNVDWMCAIPAAMFFRTFFFCLTLLAVFGCAMARLRSQRDRKSGLGGGSSRAPLQHALARALPAARVGVRPLPVYRQAAAVPEAPVAAEIHETLDVELHLTAQVALDLVVGVEDLADGLHLRVGELLDALVLGDLRLFTDLLRGRPADAIEVRERVGDMLAAGKVNTGDTCHRSNSR